MAAREEHFVTYKWLAATVISGVIAIGGMWLDLREDIGNRPTREEVNGRLDRFENRMDSWLVPRVSLPEMQQTQDGQRQFQIVLVELPESEREQTIREVSKILATQKGE